jgi:hypothetical protein
MIIICINPHAWGFFLELLSQMPEDNPIVEMKVKEWLNFQKVIVFRIPYFRE